MVGLEWTMPRLVGASMKLTSILSAGKSSAGTHAITGGTGGLGVLTALWLGSSGMTRNLVLISRSGALSRKSTDWEVLMSMPAVEVNIIQGSISEPRNVVGRVLVQPGTAPMRGVWHTAGALAQV